MLRNFWKFAVACYLFGCGERMVMSSAYVISCSGWGGSGMSEIKMLKSSGDRTAPWGTPFRKLYWLLRVLFIFVCPVLPVRKFVIQRLRLLWMGVAASLVARR